MKTTALLSCVFLTSLLVSVGATKSLNDIQELKETKFGQKYPKHGLMLLYWFVNKMNMGQAEVYRLPFNPALQPYGLNKFHNKEKAVPENMDREYYTIGDLTFGQASSQLPTYVTQDWYNVKHNQNPDLVRVSNTDRLIIRVQRNNPETVDEVYISENYDPSNTFKISPALLQQIKALSKEDAEGTCDSNEPRKSLHGCDYLNHQQKVDNLQIAYPHKHGLAWFMTLAGYKTENRLSQYSQSLICSASNVHSDPRLRSLEIKSKCEAHNKIKLVVKSTSNGYAKITWSGVPENIVKMNANVGLYKDLTLLTTQPLDGRTYGAIDTKTALNSGLQVKLTIANKVIWVGPKFHEANGVLPTKIEGYDASLQLYTKGGYAGARLIIKKTFSDWKTVFENSWVGFYGSSQDSNENYKTWQWSREFAANSDHRFPEDYNVFDFISNQGIGPGMQLRFLLDKLYDKVKARTEPWEKDTHNELEKK